MTVMYPVKQTYIITCTSHLGLYHMCLFYFNAIITKATALR